MKMSEKKELVEKYMRRYAGEHIWFSPTDVGMKVFGKTYNTASSFASPVLRELVANGKAERNAAGHYRLTG